MKTNKFHQVHESTYLHIIDKYKEDNVVLDEFISRQINEERDRKSAKTVGKEL